LQFSERHSKFPRMDIVGAQISILPLNFYVRAIARISYGNFVCLSVRPSQPGTV